VPLDIIDAKKDELSEDKKLSDFMKIYNPDSVFQIGFVYQNEQFLRIDDILLLPHINNLDVTAWIDFNKPVR
jgi:hypothetical protein